MSAPSIATQGKAAKVGGVLLRLVNAGGSSTLEKASQSDFASEKVALFIHGFTANAGYMTPIMEAFDSAGFKALAYNYPCFDGIDTAARSLFELLEAFDSLTGSAISQKRIVVVGHSMGGLVARALVGVEAGHKYVRKVITLGSPNGGTLTDSKLLEWLVAAGENISGLVHGGYSRSGRSARQLMKKDEPHVFLDKLQASAAPSGLVEFHSFSGGRRYLTIGKNPMFERVINLAIQKYLSGCENDGLVAEASSDLSGAEFSVCASGCVHHKDYADYPKINHTHLCESHILNLKVLALV
jgi:pimeloyl-ACP methyl ester carboxylesterase